MSDIIVSGVDIGSMNLLRVNFSTARYSFTISSCWFTYMELAKDIYDKKFIGPTRPHKSASSH